MPSSRIPLDIACCGAFFAFATSSVITPICLTEMSAELSTDLAQGGAMETARTALMVTMLVLAGLFAQRRGKRGPLTFGLLMLSAGLFLLATASDYRGVVAAMMVMGVGGGLTEALVNPLVADAHPRQAGKYLNLTNAFYSIGVLASVLLFGELLTRRVPWRAVFHLAGALTLAVAVFLALQAFPSPLEREEGRHSLGEIVSRRRFWAFAAAIFLGAGVESSFTFWTPAFVQVHHGGSPRAAAIGLALFAGAMAAGRLAAGRLAGQGFYGKNA